MHGGPLAASRKSGCESNAGESVNSIQIQCAQCKRRFSAKQHLAGQRVKCPACRAPIPVPDPSPIRTIEVKCDACRVDFLAESGDIGHHVACPACGMITTVRETGKDVAQPAGDPLFEELSTAGLSPFATAPQTASLPATIPDALLGGRRRSDPIALLAKYWGSGVASIVALISFLLCLLSGHGIVGGLFLIVGLAVAGIGLVLPPPRRRSVQRRGEACRDHRRISYGNWSVHWCHLDRAHGRPPASAGAVAGIVRHTVGILFWNGFVSLGGDRFCVLGAAFRVAAARIGLLRRCDAGANNGAEPFRRRRGFTARPAVQRHRFDPQQVLPESEFPDLGPPRQIAPGVDFREVDLRIPPGQPGYASKLYIYRPQDGRLPKSLPCVFIASAGAMAFMGMDLGSADQPEHIPYAQAGYVVVAYEIDGYVADADSATDRQLLRAIEQYWAASAGMVNARNAIQYALAKVPEIDPSQLYTAGHSSAGLQSLLLAENDPRIKACLAYAPVVDLELRVSDALPVYRSEIKDFDVLLKLSSPKVS